MKASLESLKDNVCNANKLLRHRLVQDVLVLKLKKSTPN